MACHHLALSTARMASWEFDTATGAVRWHVPLHAILPFVPVRIDGAAAAPAMDAIADALVTPITSTLRPGTPWEQYRLTRVVEGPAGERRELALRAVPIRRGTRVAGCVGIVVEVTDWRRIEEALDESVNRYQLLVDLSPDGIVVHQDGKIAYANRAGLAAIGARAPDEVLGRSIVEFLHPDSLGPTLERIARISEESPVSESAEATLLRLDGSPWLVESVSVLTQWEGRRAYQVILRDLTERKRAELERRLAEERYTTVVEALDEGIVAVDAKGVVETLNPAAYKLFPAARIGMHVSGIFDSSCRLVCGDGRDLGRDDHPIARALRTGRGERGAVLGLVHDGVVRWISMNTSVLRHGEQDEPYGVVCSVADITERRAAEQQLEYRATHDYLTGLANRTRLADQLDVALAAARKKGTNVAVLFVDLDRFKRINDSLGHVAGDEVLIAVAGRLQYSVRASDAVARLAGDEFVVLCCDVPSLDVAVERASEIAQLVAEPIRISTDRPVSLTTSVGVAFAEGGRADAAELLSAGDMAMYRAKQRGRARIEVFDSALRVDVERRQDVEAAVRSALEHGGLTAHFQPVVSLAHGRIVGVEALARLPRGAHGAITPGEFVPVAEESGLIVPLGRAVLERALAQLATWRSRGVASGLHMSVNVSARQLADPQFVRDVHRVVDDVGIDAESLWLEITESVLMDEPEAAARVLFALRDLGVRLVIDDFGTGYSSMAYLKRFPVDTLKIDQSFVMGIGHDPESDAIASAIVGLARSLHLFVIAEGVESHVQLERLRALGCDAIQGFLVAPPLAADEVDLGYQLPASRVGRGAAHASAPEPEPVPRRRAATQ